MKELKKVEVECAEILRSLITKYEFLSPQRKNFGVWGSEEAKEVLADLTDKIKYSQAIEDAQAKLNWRK